MVMSFIEPRSLAPPLVRSSAGADFMRFCRLTEEGSTPFIRTFRHSPGCGRFISPSRIFHESPKNLIAVPRLLRLRPAGSKRTGPAVGGAAVGTRARSGGQVD